MIIGGVWWLFIRLSKNQTPRTIKPMLVIVVGIMSFLWGVLATVYATGKVPMVLPGWGDSTFSGCRARADMTRLQSFRKNYDFILICGIADSGIDQLKNPSISVSQQFTIRPGSQDISVPWSQALKQKIDSVPEGQRYSLWHESVLLPKSTYMPGIKTLEDVVKQGGVILDPIYYDYVHETSK